MLETMTKLWRNLEIFQNLCVALKVVIDHARHLLGWNSFLTLDQGLKKTVEGMKP